MCVRLLLGFRVFRDLHLCGFAHFSGVYGITSFGFVCAFAHFSCV